jgi:hypothetical protein
MEYFYGYFVLSDCMYRYIAAVNIAPSVSKQPLVLKFVQSWKSAVQKG